MTRKRFVKLLMAYGYSRNEAQWIADSANRDNCSYEEAFVSHFDGRILEVRIEMGKPIFSNNIPITLKYEYKGSDK